MVFPLLLNKIASLGGNCPLYSGRFRYYSGRFRYYSGRLYIAVGYFILLLFDAQAALLLTSRILSAPFMKRL